MKRFILILLAGMLLGTFTAAFAQTYTAHDRTGRLNVTSDGGAVTFVITSDDPAAAENTLETAQRLQRAGTQTTVLFEESGVRLASAQLPPALAEEARIEKQQDQIDRQRYLEGEFYEGPGAEARIQQQERRQAAEARRLEESARKRIEDLVSYGGNVMACPKCMEAFGIQRASLQEGVQVAPLELVSSVHSGRVFRAPAPQAARPALKGFPRRERYPYPNTRRGPRIKARAGRVDSVAPKVRIQNSQKILDQW